MYTNLTGYKIYVGDKKDLLLKIKAHLFCSSNKKLNIVSGNPEVLFNGINNKSLGKFFKREENLIIPDGVGVIVLLKIFKKYVTKKIAGIEIMEDVLKISDSGKLGVYFLGSTTENLDFAIKNISNKYPDIFIKGSHNGYFDENEEEKIIRDINEFKTDVLFIAMGSPKQDIFIAKHIDKLNCKIFMGVGGSFDVYAGKVKRAPKIMIKFGLEWLYRVMNEPFRIKRLISIPKFFLQSINYYLRGGIND